MKKIRLYRVICVGLFVSILLFSYAMGRGETGKEELKVSSPAFKNGGEIPSKFTCDGANVNPPLKIENVPPGAKSLALIFDDIDAPRGTYVHWLMWNLDPKVKEIKENSVPENAVQGKNDFKKQNYGGPCPPGSVHRYVFKIYALNIHLNLDRGSTKANVEKAMEGHVMVKGELQGKFKRSKPSSK